MVSRRLSGLDPVLRRRLLIRTGVVVTGAWVTMLTLYSLVGFTGRPGLSVPAVLLGSVIFGAVVARQVRDIERAEVPGLRALQALGCLVPLYLVLFASIYVSMPDDSFAPGVDHAAAFYFTVTVFATVGFGDITPLTDLARSIVAAQMILNLVVLGAVVRLVVRTAQHVLEVEAVEAEGDGAPGSGRTPDH